MHDDECRSRQYHHHRHHEPPGPPWMRHSRFASEWFGPPWAGGHRARRGDVRTALLAILAEQPMHGYDLIRELEQRSGGAWRPSPGSIYPTLQMLEDEDLVTAEEREGKRVYSITDAGRADLESRRARGGGAAPWEFGEAAEGFVSLREAIFHLGAAAMQVARAGSADQLSRATDVLAEARKRLYGILSEN